MKRIYLLCLLIVPLLATAQERKNTWSFYANTGVGYSGTVSLEGLCMCEDDLRYFEQRGLTPDFCTSGRAQIAPKFTLGASYHPGRFRISGQLASQYVNQSNYHAHNFSTDLLFGYDYLNLPRHSLYLELGAGLYNLYNNYIYNWKGVDCNGNQIYRNGIAEQRSVNLGEHRVHSFSIPVKLIYEFRLNDRHSLGIFAEGRYNFAPNDFCPKYTLAAGLEYRISLGSGRKAASRPNPERDEKRCRRNPGNVIIINNYYLCPESEKNAKREEAAVVPEPKDTVVTEPKDETICYLIHFDTASSELDLKALTTLDLAIDVIRKRDAHILLEGHTDDIGSDRSNDILSILRADEVKCYLVQNGIPEEKIECRGYGESQPVRDNGTDEGKAANRRVLLTIR